METTPFLQFWNAVNQRLFEQRMPELLYGEARDLWRWVEGKALMASLRETQKAA